jgi:uncharacterized protein
MTPIGPPIAAPLGYVGAGVAYRKSHRALWLAGAGTAVTEVIPDHFFSAPGELEPVARRAQLVFHDVGLSLGTEAPLDTTAIERLDRIRELTGVARPLLFSDHLAATRAPSGLDVGHLFPICFTADSLARFADKVAFVADRLRVPIALENLAFPFQLPGSSMTEAEFCWALTERTPCGLLLDLTNLAYNCHNFGLDPRAELQHYPLHAVWQVHLSGGTRLDGFWHDTHANTVEPESLDLLELLSESVLPRVVIVERDQRLPALAELTEQAREADRRVTRGRAARSARDETGLCTPATQRGVA